MWESSQKYIGDWRDNCKEGFGIQFYKNGDKYEGMWAVDKRHGQGTYWKNEGSKLRREYTGDWYEDKKHGRGTFFYKIDLRPSSKKRELFRLDRGPMA